MANLIAKVSVQATNGWKYLRFQQELLIGIRNATTRAQIRRDWQARLWASLRVTGPGCASCVSCWLIWGGALTWSQFHAGTAELVQQLLDIGWVKVTDNRQWKNGFPVFSADDNKNKRPDHVVMMESRLNPNTVIVTDNRFGGRLYPRNITRAHVLQFTPLAFQMQPVEPAGV